MLSQSQQVLLVNGKRLEVFELKALTASFLELLGRFELRGIAFRRGVTQDELKTLVITLGRTKPDAVDPGFWREFAVENGLEHLELMQVHYSRVRKSRTMIAVVSAAEDEELTTGELKQIPDVLRALHGAAMTGSNLIVQFLIDQGAQVDARNALGWTPLMVAEGVFVANTEKAWPETVALLRELEAERTTTR